MRLFRDELEQQILDFMIVIHECYANTNFGDDRSVYAQDLAEATGWIARLRSGADAEKVVEKNLSPATAKHLGDSREQGGWGDMEAHALKELNGHINR